TMVSHLRESAMSQKATHYRPMKFLSPASAMLPKKDPYKQSLLRTIYGIAFCLFGLLLAHAAHGHAHHFRVTLGGTNDPLSATPVPLVAGVPFDVRVAAFEAGAPEDEPYREYHRDVTL